MKKYLQFLLTTLVTLFIIYYSAVVFAAETETLDTVYRVYNNKTAEHLYTTQRLEVNTLTDGDWTEEGIGWRSPKNGKAVYRLYNPKSSDHLYTLDTNEVSVLTSQHGWVSDFDGKALFYSEGSIPVYRLFNPKNGRHHLTTDAHEYQVLSTSGWTGEGIKLNCQSGFVTYLAPEAVKDRIMFLQKEYPEGRTWTNADKYTSKLRLDGYIITSGLGCHAFALICSDAAFNKLPGREHNDTNNIRVGDILRINHNSHSVIVLDVNNNEITIAEGNYNSSIHWGRVLNRNDLETDYIWTRYP